MACQMDRVLLEEYVDNLLPKLEKLLVEEHIKSCQSCKKQLTEMKLLFWEIENAGQQEIKLPENIGKVFDNIIDQFAKPKLADKAISALKGQLKPVRAGLGFVKSLPLAKSLHKGSEKAAKKVPSLASKAFDRIKNAGRNTVRSGLQSLLGGSK